ncbi:response regulator [Pseudoduganella namucuonensis]|uniref:Response regulatory domain-containing protein n=1 Tax=Pseudoduganella namucuonensis TaxID=1035707 RepID=A0A1I7JX13_9BURK|nr:response regulator [Pseudoduganella namucuonensis]SFU89717.1 hypothetical protein SAMN05216552_1013125 [Pseudoduganella namucuonensis]
MTTHKFPFAVRLAGFAPEEAAALAALLAAAPARGPAYFCLSGDSLQEPDLVLANGGDLRALAGLPRADGSALNPVLLVGPPSIDLAFPRLPLPLDAGALHAELARLVARRADALARLAAAGLPPPPERRRSERLDFDLTDPAEYAAMRGPGRRGGVLVVDQGARFSDHVALLLKPYNIACAWTDDEPSALVACADGAIAVVLINTSTPDVDPYALCAALRRGRREEGRAPAVVLLVAPPFAYDGARARAAGVEGLLDKPVSDPTLRAVLKKLMRIA